MKHTKTPWIAHNAEVWHEVPAQHTCIADCNQLPTVDLLTNPQDQANAAFIVKACNYHKELLDHLKAATEVYREACSCGTCGPCTQLIKMDLTILKIEGRIEA